MTLILQESRYSAVRQTFSGRSLDVLCRKGRVFHFQIEHHVRARVGEPDHHSGVIKLPHRTT